MLAYIKGKLEFKHNEYIVVECNGIGYKIYTALSTIDALGSNASDEIKVYTHLYVREDILSLYGFLTTEELGIFELLISVSGVGPKAAIAMLSAISPSKFGLAVITDDIKALTRAQGVGNKMAQRIILELKDKIKKQQLNTLDVLKEEMPHSKSNNSSVNEAVSALMVLGYTPLEANKAVSSAYSDGMDVESIIKNALKMLAR